MSEEIEVFLNFNKDKKEIYTEPILFKVGSQIYDKAKKEYNTLCEIAKKRDFKIVSIKKEKEQKTKIITKKML